MKIAIVVFVLSSIISFLCVPLVIKIALKYGLVDDPSIRKHPAHTHTGVIPRAGGLGILFSIIVCALFLIPINRISLSILIGGIFIVLIGIIDDKIDLSPKIRLISNFIIASFVVASGIGVPYITNPFGGIIELQNYKIQIDFFGKHSFLYISNLFSIFWIVSMTNFINWSKGVDGQLPGFVTVAGLFIGVFALRFSAFEISKESVFLLSFIVAGAYFGFLFWNMYPQKIMPGYSGGALAGYMLSVLSILSFSKIGFLTIILSIPLVDAIYVVVRRIIRKKSPLYGDSSHFHHRLLAIGWGKRRIAFFYWVTSFLFGLAALFFQGYQKLLAIFCCAVLLAFFLWICESIQLKK